MIESAALTNPITYVCDERIDSIGQGILRYSPGNDKDGKLVLESIKFTCGTGPDAILLGTCSAIGSVIPVSKMLGVIGRVSPDGRYKLTAIKGVGFQDTIYVSYNYEFKLPV